MKYKIGFYFLIFLLWSVLFFSLGFTVGVISTRKSGTNFAIDKYYSSGIEEDIFMKKTKEVGKK